eukprot:TRINITY_DN1898_c0_g1_i1.p1 TRINITY_DN1898_c0_g1~~TRINITY_DN1898_c0_g1_i1.p1  ORF type:complete len:424 (-),score=87.58 TRINITY_DN1898_c0_g1_i1:2-1273(-)
MEEYPLLVVEGEEEEYEEEKEKEAELYSLLCAEAVGKVPAIPPEVWTLILAQRVLLLEDIPTLCMVCKSWDAAVRSITYLTMIKEDWEHIHKIILADADLHVMKKSSQFWYKKNRCRFSFSAKHVLLPDFGDFGEFVKEWGGKDMKSDDEEQEDEEEEEEEEDTVSGTFRFYYNNHLWDLSVCCVLKDSDELDYVVLTEDQKRYHEIPKTETEQLPTLIWIEKFGKKGKFRKFAVEKDPEDKRKVLSWKASSMTVEKTEAESIINLIGHESNDLIEYIEISDSISSFKSLVSEMFVHEHANNYKTMKLIKWEKVQKYFYLTYPTWAPIHKAFAIIFGVFLHLVTLPLNVLLLIGLWFYFVCCFLANRDWRNAVMCFLAGTTLPLVIVALLLYMLVLIPRRLLVFGICRGSSMLWNFSIYRQES